MKSTVQMPKAETTPFWTEEKHVHFLNTMEASFVRTMLHRNGRQSSGSWQLRLDRHLPDSSESTLDSDSKKKHAASDSLLMMGRPRSRSSTEKRRSTRRRRRRSSHHHQLQNSSMEEEEQVVPEIEIGGGREDAGFVGDD